MQLLNLEKKAVTSGIKPLSELTENELVEMEGNFSKVLTGVMRRAAEEFRDVTGATDAKLRGFVIDQILSWGRGDGFSGVWLKYVDTMRPGAKMGLFEKVKVAADILSLDVPVRHSPRSEAIPSSSDSPTQPMPTWPTKYTVSDHILRLGFAVASGVTLWAVTPATILGGFVAAGAAASGALLGYVIGGPVVAGIRAIIPRQDLGAARKKASNITTEVAPEYGKILNVNLFEQEMLEWLSRHVRAERIDVPARCRALTQKLTPVV